MSQNREHQPGAVYNRMHLFVIRVWHEPGSEGKPEWHGRLQRVVNGESKAFHGLDGLTTLLETYLLPSDQASIQNTPGRQEKHKTIEGGTE